MQIEEPSLYISIDPCSKPRMTRADKWKKRPIVLKYFAWCNELRGLMPRDYDLTNKHITFIIRMPKSWPKYKKEEMHGQPHTQTPDLSNLLKALEDAHQAEDKTIHRYQSLTKIWGDTGAIIISL